MDKFAIIAGDKTIIGIIIKLIGQVYILDGDFFLSNSYM